MTPLPRLLCAWTALSLGLLATLAWAEAQGFVSGRVVTLWARSIVFFDAPVAFQATAAFLPPIPDLLTLAARGITGGATIPAPFLPAAGLGAALVLMWFRALRVEAGFAWPPALVTTALLALNPFFLRAVSDGPGTVLLLIGIWIYARGLVSLRQSGNAPDMMKVAVGLLLTVLSHPYGLLVCVAALPCILVAARPGILAASPGGYVVAMFFPILAGMGGLLFVNAIFDRVLPPLPSYDPAQARPLAAHLLILAGTTPVVALAIFRTVRTARHFRPLVATAATVLVAYGLNLPVPVEPDPSIAIAAMLPVVAAAMRYWPPVEMRGPAVASLLALGVALSAVSVTSMRDGETGRWLDAVLRRGPGALPPSRAVATFLGGKDGILIDAERNPEIVAALRGAGTLLLAGQPAYDIAMRGGQVRSGFIVVAREGRGTSPPDRVLQRFPQLSSDTLKDYEQIYQDADWRVFGRTGSRG